MFAISLTVNNSNILPSCSKYNFLENGTSARRGATETWSPRATTGCWPTETWSPRATMGCWPTETWSTRASTGWWSRGSLSMRAGSDQGFKVVHYGGADHSKVDRDNHDKLVLEQYYTN